MIWSNTTANTHRFATKFYTVQSTNRNTVIWQQAHHLVQFCVMHENSLMTLSKHDKLRNASKMNRIYKLLISCVICRPPSRAGPCLILSPL